MVGGGESPDEHVPFDVWREVRAALRTSQDHLPARAKGLVEEDSKKLDDELNAGFSFIQPEFRLLSGALPEPVTDQSLTFQQSLRVVLCVLPDGSGGGSRAEGILEMIRNIDRVVTVYTSPSTYTRGAIGAYRELEFGYWAAAALAIATMDVPGLNLTDEEYAQIASEACDLAKKIAGFSIDFTESLGRILELSEAGLSSCE